MKHNIKRSRFLYKKTNRSKKITLFWYSFFTCNGGCCYYSGCTSVPANCETNAFELENQYKSVFDNYKTTIANAQNGNGSFYGLYDAKDYFDSSTAKLAGGVAKLYTVKEKYGLPLQ